MKYRLLNYYALLAMICGLQLRADTRTTSNGEEIGISIMGTIVNSNGKDNVALIKELKAGHVRAVKKGYTVLSYMVVDVQTKYILLKSAKDFHLVYQDKFSGDFLPRKKESAYVPSESLAQDSYSEDGFERKGTNIRMAAGYRDKMIEQDLSKILMQASAVPNYEDGALKGFRLLQIDKKSIFDNAGFLDDDIVTSISGVPLASIPGAIKLLHSLKRETQVQFEVMRGGKYLNFTININ